MASPRARSWRRRVRRSWTLTVNVHKAIQLAGGLMPFATLSGSCLTKQGLNHWLTWLIGAVSWGQRANAVWYRRWLATESAAASVPRSASVPTLWVFSTIGLAEDALSCYLEAIARASCPPQTDRLLVTDGAGCACAQSIANATQRPLLEVVGVERLSVGIVAHCARSRFEVGGAMRYRLLVLLRPGYLPGEMPCLGSEGAVLYYGDEDCVDARGQRQRPFFKCGYSPDLFMHQDYISSWMALTSDLVARLSLQPPVADYYDLALMLAESADRVEHVSAFVAHRHLPSLNAAASSIPCYLQSFLRNRYDERVSIASRDAGWTCHFGNADRFVSVVIPTKDRADLLDNCVRGIYETNAAGGFEVIVIDNGSVQRSTTAWLCEAKRRFERFRVVPAPQPYNWSRLNNIGAAHAEGDVLVFLNNDTVPRSVDWLARLADVACRPDVGLVGALLLYAAGTIQHAGVVTGFSGCVDHIYKGVLPSDDNHMFVPPTAVRNVSAVTGACMAVSRRVLDTIGPFDEGYRVAGGDVEICLRALTKGFLNVYLPEVELLHLESQSRSPIDPESDVTQLKALIANGFSEDVWYNRRLSMISTYPSYPIFPRQRKEAGAAV